MERNVLTLVMRWSQGLLSRFLQSTTRFLLWSMPTVASDTTKAEYRRVIFTLIGRIETMSAQIDDLVASVTTLKTQKDAAVANAAGLKAKLDAAIAGLVTAQAGSLTPAEVALITQAATDVKAVSQALADSTAVTSPAN